MGFFDELKATINVTKDIIRTGKESFKACEAMDALIERAKGTGELSTDCLNAIKALEAARNSEESDDKQKMIEEAQVSCLEAFQKDAKLSTSFKEECKAAIQTYKDVNNGIMDRLGDTLSEFAESDEQREEIRNAVNSEKQ